MDHGISFLPDSDGTLGPSAAEYFATALRLSRMADEGGLSHVKMTEHYLRAYGGFCPSPLTFLASVASVTSRIRLMTGCILPVFHHPIRLAAETAMVDAISAGRLDVGFARAYLPYEFDAFGVDMDGSRDRFDATVATVVRLWSQAEVSEDTGHFRFDSATSLPRPVQRPHPPVWIAAVMSPESFVRAGERGFGLLITPSISPLTEVAGLVESYRQAFVPARPEDHPRVLASLPLFVAATQQRAQAVADPLLERYLQVWADSATDWSTRSSRDYRGYTGMAYAIRAMTGPRMRTSGGAVVGSPAYVEERILGLSETLGVDGFLWQVDFGGAPRDTALDNLDMFLSEVHQKVM